jgi:LysM repeat protein
LEEKKKMSKKFILILLAVLALTLNACTRAASVAVGTPTPDVNFPVAMATSAMNAIEIAGTQTAVATAGLPIPPAAGTDTGTQAAGDVPPVSATFTPLAGAATNTPDGSLVLPSPTTQVTAVNTPVPMTAAPVVKPGSYTLKEGEFVYCIARRFNVNPDEVLNLNGLTDGQTVYAGRTLTMPSTNNHFPGTLALKAHPAQYTVRAGDSIYSIACLFGDVDPLQIAAANNLSGSYNLTTGSLLQIP